MRNYRICLSCLGFLLSFQLLSVSHVFASITRTRTMGDVGMIIKDNANHWLFPAAIVNYPNQAILEWGGKSELLAYSSLYYGFDQWAGGIINFGKNNPKTLGAFWSEASSNNPFQTFSIGVLRVIQKYDLFSAINTQAGAWGLHLSRSSGRYESLHNPGVHNKTSISQTRCDVGFSRSNFDFTFGYQFAAFTVTGGKIEGHSFYLSHRWFKPIRAKFTLVPLVNFAISFENQQSSSSTNGRYWMVWTGAGLNYQVDTNDLLVLGITIRRTSQLIENESSNIKYGATVLDLPFVFGGLETELCSWLKLRLGFQKALRRTAQSNEYDVSTQETISIQAPFAATAGLGIQYKRLTIDLSWDSNFLKRGPYFLSGSKGDMFNLISMSYIF